MHYKNATDRKSESLLLQPLRCWDYSIFNLHCLVCPTSLGANDTWENANKKVDRTLPLPQAFLIFFLSIKSDWETGSEKKGASGSW